MYKHTIPSHKSIRTPIPPQPSTKIVTTAIAPPAKGRPRIALVSPASFGDCINSTLMLKPIKAKYPNAAIDVYTSTYYDSAFKNNPLITQTIPTKAETKKEAIHLLSVIPENLRTRNYDLVLSPHPMTNPDKWHSNLHPEFGQNLICAWMNSLEEHNIPYKLPLETHLYLDNKEVARVNEFCAGIPYFKERRKTLMEILGESGQTHWTPDWTLKTIHHLCSNNQIVFISCKVHNYRTLTVNTFKHLQSQYPHLVHFINNLSIREAAELFNRCDRFISVSSGLSNACNTNWCKKDIEWIEVINSKTVSSAPLRTKGKTFLYENDVNSFIKLLQQSSIQ